MSALSELSSAAQQAATAAGPSVVRIGRNGGRGCGVVIRTGLVVTNAHNLRGDETTVTFDDGREASGAVAGVDVDGDLAVLTVDTGATPSLPFSGHEAVAGEVVFAVTRSGAGGTRVSFGLVSATARAFRGPRGRNITGSIEHTAPLPRGSSGGPIVDAEGHLLGINTNRLGDGFYLALPADADLQSRLDSLAAGESRATPRLGVGLAPPHVARKLRRAVGLPERDGLLVRVVEDGSPAHRAGIRAGDLIAEAAGEAVTSMDVLYDALERGSDEGGLDLTIVRGVDELHVRVTFAENGGSDEGSA